MQLPQDGAGAQHSWIAAMRRGDFAAAWRISDAVLAARDTVTCDDPRLPYHLRWVWDGRAFDARHALVRCYHGLGDTIQFARYLAPLRRRVTSLVVEAPPALVGWLAGVPGPDHIVAFDVARPLPPRDANFEIMELAHALRLPPDRVARPVSASGDRGQAQNRTRIGVCWQAGNWAPERSIPLRSLLEVLPGQSLVSLQRGPRASEATEAAGFCNPLDDDRDILRTAALIAGCRLVVTVDTMVAHLAGILGAPTLLLLQHQPDWRWESGEGVSRWYPSVRMARQHAAGNWSAPLRIIGALAAQPKLS